MPPLNFFGFCGLPCTAKERGARGRFDYLVDCGGVAILPLVRWSGCVVPAWSEWRGDGPVHSIGRGAQRPRRVCPQHACIVELKPVPGDGFLR